MTWIKKQADGTYEEFNFVAPEGKTKEDVLFPLGDVQEPAYGAILAVDIEQMETFLQPAELTGNVTINLAINAQVTKGAKLHLKLDADGTNRVVTLGDGFEAPATLTVVANTVWYVSFVYDGTAFLPMYNTPAT